MYETPYCIGLCSSAVSIPGCYDDNETGMCASQYLVMYMYEIQLHVHVCSIEEPVLFQFSVR